MEGNLGGTGGGERRENREWRKGEGGKVRRGEDNKQENKGGR